MIRLMRGQADGDIANNEHLMHDLLIHTNDPLCHQIVLTVVTALLS